MIHRFVRAPVNWEQGIKQRPGPGVRQYLLGGLAAFLCVALVYLIRRYPNSSIAAYLGAVAVVLGVISAVPPVIALLRRPGSDPGAPARSARPAQDELADRIATAVRHQHRRDTDVSGTYQQERYLRLRWVNDPGPDGTDDPGTALRAVGPHDSPLAVLDAYRKVRGRWVILGRQGAGKTTLMLRLQSALLSPERIRSGVDIPVVFPLATWNPQVPFHDWLARQIADRYPALARSVRDADLVNLVLDRILPILDGFDEIPPGNRDLAVKALNRLPPEQGFVLTSRVEEYRAHARGTHRVTLNRAIVSTIADLSVDDVAEYLAGSTTTPVEEWRVAATGTGADDPVRDLLTTPVAIWPIGELGDISPADLRGMGDTSAEIAAGLFRELIAERFAARSRYRGSAPGGRAWPPESARAWLATLARYVSDRVERSRLAHPPSDRDPQDIAWWELADELRPALPWLGRLASGLVPGTAFALGLTLVLDSVIGSPWSVVVAAGTAATFGVSIALLGGRTGTVPPTTVELGSLRAGVGAVAAVFVAVIAVAVSLIIDGRITNFTVVGILLGAVVGMPYALVNEMDIAHAQSPTIVYERDRRFVWVYALVYGLPCTAFGLRAAQAAGRSWVWGLVFGLAAAAAGGLFNGIPWLVVNALAGRGKTARTVGTVAWARFQIARLVWSGSEPRLPWRLLPFLDECVAAGLMRQLGPVYQFRHQIVWRALVGRRPADPVTPAAPPRPRPGTAPTRPPVETTRPQDG